MNLLDPSRLDRQLRVLGVDRARVITSIAAGIDQTRQESPFASQFLASEIIPAYAALYATVRRVCTEAANDPECPQREDAIASLALLDQIVAAVDAPDPNPPEKVPQDEMLARILGRMGIPTMPASAEIVEGEIITDTAADEAFDQMLAEPVKR